MIHNIGPEFFIWIIVLGVYFLAVVVPFFKTLPMIFHQSSDYITKKLVWSGFIRLMIAMFLDLSTASFLQITNLNFESDERVISSLIALSIIGVYVILILYMHYKVHQTRHTPYDLWL
jgi:quinol-cytochrome oxidoreductase complex cytochrome b subunit